MLTSESKDKPCAQLYKNALFIDVCLGFNNLDLRQAFDPGKFTLIQEDISKDEVKLLNDIFSCAIYFSDYDIVNFFIQNQWKQRPQYNDLVDTLDDLKQIFPRKIDYHMRERYYTKYIIRNNGKNFGEHNRKLVEQALSKEYPKIALYNFNYPHNSMHFSHNHSRIQEFYQYETHDFTPDNVRNKLFKDLHILNGDITSPYDVYLSKKVEDAQLVYKPDGRGKQTYIKYNFLEYAVSRDMDDLVLSFVDENPFCVPTSIGYVEEKDCLRISALGWAILKGNIKVLDLLLATIYEMIDLGHFKIEFQSVLEACLNYSIQNAYNTKVTEWLIKKIKAQGYQDNILLASIREPLVSDSHQQYSLKEVLPKLLECSESKSLLEKTNDQGETALHLAVIRGDYAKLSYLINVYSEHKMLDIKNKRGLTAMDVAYQSMRDKVGNAGTADACILLLDKNLKMPCTHEELFCTYMEFLIHIMAQSYEYNRSHSKINGDEKIKYNTYFRASLNTLTEKINISDEKTRGHLIQTCINFIDKAGSLGYGDDSLAFFDCSFVKMLSQQQGFISTDRAIAEAVPCLPKVISSLTTEYLVGAKVTMFPSQPKAVNDTGENESAMNRAPKP